MRTRREILPLSALLWVGLCLIPTATRAELIHFTIDQAQSALTISGTFSSFAITQQGPGSLVTRYAGTIEAEVTTSNILFLGGSLIAGLTNGNWEPDSGGTPGTAPANYGGQVVNLLVNGKAAMRDVVFDVASEELPVVGGTFLAQGLQFNFVPTGTSVIDYAYSITFGSSGNGGQALTGTSTNAASTNATVGAQGGQTVLTIPVDISGSVTVVNPNDVQYRFRGQLVARASLPVALQILSFHVNPGQVNFTIATEPGRAYTILGSTNLMDWPVVIDQFTATNNPSQRAVALPTSRPQQYFRVRQD